MVSVNSNYELFDGSNVLITGNSGFKGSWLSAWLHQLGANVFGLSLDIPTEPSLFSHLPERIKNQTLWGDVSSLDAVLNAIEISHPDFVFHLAAQPLVGKSYENPYLTWKSNTLGTVALLEALRIANIPRVVAVMITSDKVYKNKEWDWPYRESDEIGGYDPYSASKGAAELAIQSYAHSGISNFEKINFASVRAGNVIGGGDWAAGRIVPDFVRAWNGKNELLLRNPNSTRPWQHVLEPLSGYLLTAKILSVGGITRGDSFNFGPSFGSPKTVMNLLSEFSKVFPDFPDIRLAQGSVSESNLLSLSIDKATRRLDWEPVLSFEETAKWTAEWYKGFYTGKDPYELTTNQIQEYRNLSSARDRGIESS